MQTTTIHSAPADALLAGAILEEYRDLLVSQSLEARQSRKKPRGDTDDCDGGEECGNSPSCQENSRRPKSQPTKKIAGWNDLPRA